MITNEKRPDAGRHEASSSKASFPDVLGMKHTFQTFDDSEAKRPDLGQVMHGTLDECRTRLEAPNKRGADTGQVQLRDGLFNIKNNVAASGIVDCGEAAHRWLDFGLQTIPLDEEKKTAVKWDKWLDNLTHDSITAHWAANPDHNVGAIVDDKLFVIDADTIKGVARLQEIEESCNVTPNMIHKTSKGEHHFFRRAPSTYAMMASYNSKEHPEKLDIRTGRSATEGRSMVVLPPSEGKSVILCKAESIDDLVEVDQGFIDAIFKHNGKEPPRLIEPAIKAESNRKASESEVAEILSYIKPDSGYEIWLKVLMALHDKFRGDDVGLFIADDWSSQGSTYVGFEEIEYKWRSFSINTFNQITFSTVCWMAAEAGADLKKIASHYDAQGNRYRTFEELLADAQAMSKETASADIEALTASTLGLSVIDREKVLDAIKRAAGARLGTLHQIVKDADREARKTKNVKFDDPNKLRPMEYVLFPDLSFTGDTGIPEIQQTIDNTAAMLKHYGIAVRYDAIGKKNVFTIPNLTVSQDNVDNSSLTHIISLAKLNRMGTEQIPGYVQLIADMNEFNPVADWINSKPWDGIDRLTDLVNTITPRADYPSTFRDVLMRKWLLSCVAAVLHEGFYNRGVLTLQSGQGMGKASWFRSLVPDKALCKRFVKNEHTLDPGNKDTIIGAITHWIVELGELDGSFRKDIARIKGILTASMDKIRRPYARAESEYQRKTVFCASVNNSQFLVDETGNTRFWTISVIDINYEHNIDMQQAWAQIKEQLYNAGEQWHLTKAEEKQLELLNRNHRAVSSVRELITSHMNLSQKKDTWKHLTATSVLRAVGYDKPTNAQAREAGQVLRELFGEPTKSNGCLGWRIPYPTHLELDEFDRMPNESPALLM